MKGLRIVERIKLPGISALPQRIRERRKELGLKQGDLAAEIGATQATISSYESGETSPTADMLVAIARVLRTSPDWLLGVSNEVRPDALGNLGLSALEQAVIELVRAFPEEKHQALIDLLNDVRRIGL